MIECEFTRPDLLIETYSGKVNVDDIIILKEHEFAHEKFKDGIKIIADLRTADFYYNVSESEKLKAFFTANKNKLIRTKIAFLTGDEKRESYSLFMEELEKLNAGTRIRLFTDIKDANVWLGEKD